MSDLTKLLVGNQTELLKLIAPTVRKISNSQKRRGLILKRKTHILQQRQRL